MWCAGEGECAASSSIHKGPITSLTALPEEQGALLVSSGKDHYLKLTAVPREPSPEGTAAPTLLAVYKGHTEAVQCTAASPEGSLLLSGSWDTTLRLWRAGEYLSPFPCATVSLTSPLRLQSFQHVLLHQRGDVLYAFQFWPFEFLLLLLVFRKGFLEEDGALGTGP